MNDKQSKALEVGLNRVARRLNIKDQREIVLNLAKQWTTEYYYGAIGDLAKYKAMTTGLRIATEILMELEEEDLRSEDL